MASCSVYTCLWTNPASWFQIIQVLHCVVDLSTRLHHVQRKSLDKLQWRMSTYKVAPGWTSEDGRSVDFAGQALDPAWRLGDYIMIPCGAKFNLSTEKKVAGCSLQFIKGASHGMAIECYTCKIHFWGQSSYFYHLKISASWSLLVFPLGKPAFEELDATMPETQLGPNLSFPHGGFLKWRIPNSVFFHGKSHLEMDDFSG